MRRFLIVEGGKILGKSSPNKIVEGGKILGKSSPNKPVLVTAARLRLGMDAKGLVWAAARDGER